MPPGNLIVGKVGRQRMTPPQAQAHLDGVVGLINGLKVLHVEAMAGNLPARLALRELRALLLDLKL